MDFYAHGKLLLTGEYFVLDGALALALPTKMGQRLRISGRPSQKINWHSFDYDHTLWFEGFFALPSGKYLEGTDEKVGQRLSQIFEAIRQKKPDFFNQFDGLQIETYLEFPRQWGLGSSSTLLANLAEWVQVDPYWLLQQTFGGSGYDLACATAEGPILYQLSGGRPVVQPAGTLFAGFREQLFFVYLGKKQDSREGIAHYRQKVKGQPALVAEISNFTRRLLHCQDLTDFEIILQQHESLVANTLALPRAKERYFADYWGEIKSLGAWGGDFVLATSRQSAEETHSYFNEKGFGVVLPYKKLIL